MWNCILLLSLYLLFAWLWHFIHTSVLRLWGWRRRVSVSCIHCFVFVKPCNASHRFEPYVCATDIVSAISSWYHSGGSVLPLWAIKKRSYIEAYKERALKSQIVNTYFMIRFDCKYFRNEYIFILHCKKTSHQFNDYIYVYTLILWKILFIKLMLYWYK